MFVSKRTGSDPLTLTFRKALNGTREWYTPQYFQSRLWSNLLIEYRRLTWHFRATSHSPNPFSISWNNSRIHNSISFFTISIEIAVNIQRISTNLWMSSKSNFGINSPPSGIRRYFNIWSVFIWFLFKAYLFQLFVFFLSLFFRSRFPRPPYLKTCRDIQCSYTRIVYRIRVVG